MYFVHFTQPVLLNNIKQGDNYMINETYQKARKFIYLNARPLDISRWKYHFENGSKDAVLEALACYQNEDGGFGHALEADSWNPNSAPIQTWAATEILREINFNDKSHPLIKGILMYLESGKDFDGKVWYNTVKSNNDYPHAPWWHTESESACHDDYNPTACFAGFIIRFAEKDRDIYKTGCRIAKEAFEKLMVCEKINDMHIITCYVRMLEYLKEANEENIVDLKALKEKLSEQVNMVITTDTEEWENSYICKPSQFFNNKANYFYEENKEMAQYECEYILKTQLNDGSWNIPWDWSDYSKEWAVSKNWWKSNLIILNLLYLRGMNS